MNLRSVFSDHLCTILSPSLIHDAFQTQNSVYEIVSDVNSRQDMIEERLSCLEEKLNNIQLSLELLPDMLSRSAVNLDHTHFLKWIANLRDARTSHSVISNYSVWIYWPGIWQRGRWILIPSFHALCGREVIFLICLNKLSISRQFVKSLTDKGLGISRSLSLSVLPRGQQKLFSCVDHRHAGIYHFLVSEWFSH